MLINTYWPWGTGVRCSFRLFCELLGVFSENPKKFASFSYIWSYLFWFGRTRQGFITSLEIALESTGASVFLANQNTPCRTFVPVNWACSANLRSYCKFSSHFTEVSPTAQGEISPIRANSFQTWNRNGFSFKIRTHGSHLSLFSSERAQNNGRSPDNDRPKMPLDWSLFYLTGHFDRPHLYAFR